MTDPEEWGGLWELKKNKKVVKQARQKQTRKEKREKHLYNIYICLITMFKHVHVYIYMYLKKIKILNFHLPSFVDMRQDCACYNDIFRYEWVVLQFYDIFYMFHWLFKFSMTNFINIY